MYLTYDHIFNEQLQPKPLADGHIALCLTLSFVNLRVGRFCRSPAIPALTPRRPVSAYQRNRPDAIRERRRQLKR